MDSVMTVIGRCMQRDAEPLSVIDLIESGTLGSEQAAWLVSMIDRGSSWLVGAGPPGAGKTTLMSTLLTFLPSRERAVLAGPGAQWESFGPDCCVVTEEISSHQRERYLWDEDVRRFTALPARGLRIASTIHADTLEQARDQIADQCAAGEGGLAAFTVFIPIELEFGPETDAPSHGPPAADPRRVGKGPHRRNIVARTVQGIHCYCNGTWGTIERQLRLTADQESVRRFLDTCCESGIRSCKAVRTAWLGQR